VASHAARQAAYAELVAGLLDVRDQSAQERFDIQLARLVDLGHLTPDVARSVRLLQRHSVRAVVEHAQVVLPATLMALEQSHREQWLDQLDSSSDSVDNSSDDIPDFVYAEDRTEPAIGGANELADEPTDEMPDDLTDDNVAHDGPIDLTARRLLVAGLTLLPDP